MTHNPASFKLRQMSALGSKLVDFKAGDYHFLGTPKQTPRPISNRGMIVYIIYFPPSPCNAALLPAQNVAVATHSFVDPRLQIGQLVLLFAQSTSRPL